MRNKTGDKYAVKGHKICTWHSGNLYITTIDSFPIGARARSKKERNPENIKQDLNNNIYSALSCALS